MSSFAQISKRLDRAVATAVSRHQGPKLWLLSPAQLTRYQDWQARCSKILEQYKPGSFFEAYLNGTAVELPELPADLARALQISPAPSIPLNSTETEAYRIYESFIR